MEYETRLSYSSPRHESCLDERTPRSQWPMTPEMHRTTDEATRLSAWIDDLVGLTTLPALRSGGEPSAVLGGGGWSLSDAQWTNEASRQ